MQRRSELHISHTAPITAFTYNQPRREYITGGEDGLIHIFDESGTQTRSLALHSGWITGLFFHAEFRCLFSCGLDGTIIQYGSAYQHIRTVKVVSHPSTTATINTISSKHGQNGLSSHHHHPQNNNPNTIPINTSKQGVPSSSLVHSALHSNSNSTTTTTTTSSTPNATSMNSTTNNTPTSNIHATSSSNVPFTQRSNRTPSVSFSTTVEPQRTTKDTHLHFQQQQQQQQQPQSQSPSPTSIPSNDPSTSPQSTITSTVIEESTSSPSPFLAPTSQRNNSSASSPSASSSSPSTQHQHIPSHPSSSTSTANGPQHSAGIPSGPLLGMTWDLKTSQLIVSSGKGWIYTYRIYKESKDAGSPLLFEPVFQARPHRDVIRCLVSSSEGRLFTGSFDRSICIIDLDHPHHLNHTRIPKAHTAAITCLAWDSDHGWIISGSYDSTVKVWSPEGPLLHRLDGFTGPITGLAYVPVRRTFWVSVTGTEFPIIYDAQTVVNITDYVLEDKPLHYRRDPDMPTTAYARFGYISATSELFGVQENKNLVIWRFNRKASTAIIRGHTDVVEALAATVKDGSLQLFSGGGDGTIRRWEPRQLNTSLYKSDTLATLQNTVLCLEYSAEHGKLVTGTENGQVIIWHVDSHVGSDPTALADALIALTSGESQPEPRKLTTPKSGSAGSSTKLNSSASKSASSSFRSSSAGTTSKRALNTRLASFRASVAVLSLGQKDKSASNGADSDGKTPASTTTAAGMLSAWDQQLKVVLEDHRDKVGDLVLVDHLAVSVSWDCSIRLWDILTCTPGKALEGAHDDIIHCIAYSNIWDEILTGSADGTAKSWSLSDLSPVTTFTGHKSDVVAVVYNPVHGHWVTAGDDATIRIWSRAGEDLGMLPSAGGSITAMTVDSFQGWIIAAAQDKALRVYDQTQSKVLSESFGHADSIRSIIHAGKQYFTASWDGTIRSWNAHTVPAGKRRGLTGAANAVLVGVRLASSVKDEDADKGSNDQDADDQDLAPRYADLHPLVPPATLSSLTVLGIENMDRIISDFSTYSGNGAPGSISAGDDIPEHQEGAGGPPGRLPAGRRKRGKKNSTVRAEEAMARTLTDLESKFLIGSKGPAKSALSALRRGL